MTIYAFHLRLKVEIDSWKNVALKLTEFLQSAEFK